MTPVVPTCPKLFHITHWKNLLGIVEYGGLWSDAKRLEKDLHTEIIGISDIKNRRLKELDVKCYPGTRVGDYVPFYFCPRSIMLYILRMGNRTSLSYYEGQEPIVHLVAGLEETVSWANAHGRKWAFSDRNAGIRYASFFNQLSDLTKIDWSAVANNDFRDQMVKEGKQAEFLVYEFFPWELVKEIGVASDSVGSMVTEILIRSEHKPRVTVEKTWYF